MDGREGTSSTSDLKEFTQILDGLVGGTQPEVAIQSLADSILFTQNDDWRQTYWCKPVTFREFVISKYHANVTPLSARQYEALFKLISEDPLKVFDKERTKHLLVLLVGKGGGKDYITSMLQMYLFYLLLCMLDPHVFFGFPKDENIDIINVATSAKQARKIFFNKFSQRIKNWRWLLENFRVIRRGRLVRGCVGARMEIRITDTSIETENNIRCNSEHSDAGGYEGYNVLAFVMDEASEFDDKFEQVIEGTELINMGKAQIIYDTLRTSATSRSWPWLGIVISFPRRQDDFTIRMYEYAIAHPDSFMVADRCTTWEFNPRFDLIPRYTFEKWEVPITLKPEFDTNPVDAKMRYCTEPPVVMNAFFTNKSRIYDCIDESIQPLLEVEPGIDDILDASNKTVRYVIKRILSSLLVDRTKAYCVHVDLSIVKDTTSFIIAHSEPCSIKSTFVSPDGKQEAREITNMAVVDQIFTWEPTPYALVSVMNVDEILEALRGLTNYSFLSYDQFQSAYVLEKATRIGVNVEKHNINDMDYVLLRNMIYAGAVKFPKNPKLILELERLIYTGKRVDHLPIYSKDIADCLAGVTRAIAGGLTKTSGLNFVFMDDGLFGPE